MGVHQGGGTWAEESQEPPRLLRMCFVLELYAAAPAARVTRLSPEVLKHKQFSQNYVFGVSIRWHASSCTKVARRLCRCGAFPRSWRGVDVALSTAYTHRRTAYTYRRTAYTHRRTALAAPAASPARSHSRAKRLARLAGKLTPRRAVVRRRQPPEHNKISVILYANPRW